MTDPVKTPSTIADAAGTPERVMSLLQGAIEDELLSGAVLVVSRGGNVIIRSAKGAKLPGKVPGSEDPAGHSNAIEINTVFDLGGITAALCTTSVIAKLLAAGKIAVTDRASRYIQALGVGQKSQITVGHLLSHTSGFPASAAVYDELVRANAGPRPGILVSSGAKAYAYNYFVRLPLKFDPGTKQLHSDVNSVLLGQIIEVITGLPLEKAFFKYVASPLKLKSLSFIDIAAMRRRGFEPVVEMFAPSGDCPKRERLIAGEVWDESAWAMGGVAGHAGLFGVASEVHTWGTELLRAYKGESEYLPQGAIRALWEPELPAVKPGWKFGWDPSTKENGFADSKIASRAVVTSGATGSSVFLDPERDIVAVLLSNAGFSGHMHRRFLPWRAEVHAALLDAQ